MANLSKCINVIKEAAGGAMSEVEARALLKEMLDAADIKDEAKLADIDDKLLDRVSGQMKKVFK